MGTEWRVRIAALCSWFIGQRRRPQPEPHSQPELPHLTIELAEGEENGKGRRRKGGQGDGGLPDLLPFGQICYELLQVRYTIQKLMTSTNR